MSHDIKVLFVLLALGVIVSAFLSTPSKKPEADASGFFTGAFFALLFSAVCFALIRWAIWGR